MDLSVAIAEGCEGPAVFGECQVKGRGSAGSDEGEREVVETGEFTVVNLCILPAVAEQAGQFGRAEVVCGAFEVDECDPGKMRPESLEDLAGAISPWLVATADDNQIDATGTARQFDFAAEVGIKRRPFAYQIKRGFLGW